MIGSLVTLLLIGVIGLVLIGVVLALVGVVFSFALGLAGFLLFKVLPVVLLGYLIVRFLAPREKRLARMERKLLEGD